MDQATTMDQSWDDELPVQVSSNKSTVDSLRNHECSQLLKLPGELRNMIFRYAFQEPCTFVRRTCLGEIKFVVEPENYPTTPRYPLSDLLARAAICREVHTEFKHRSIHINIFRVHYVDSVRLCIDRMPTAVRAKVKCMTLGLSVTNLSLYDLMYAGMDRLMGLKCVVVDIDFHPLPTRSDEEKNARLRQSLTKILSACTQIDVDVVFE